MRLNYALFGQLIGWMLRGVVLCWMLGALHPTGARLLPDAPHQVDTQEARMCVHTRLVDEVEEWKIQRSMQLIREMGAGTIVEFFPWAYVETAPGQYNWERVDRVVRHAQNNGIQVIARMGFVPEWVQRQSRESQRPMQNVTFNYLPSDGFDEFADFVAAFAARYRGVIDQIIIWNEPNLAFEWGYQAVDVEGYVRLLQTVYAPAHAANPDVQILAGALAPTLEPETSPYALNDALYLERMYQLGAADYFDVLAVHTYGFRQPHDAPPAPDALNFRRVELLRDVMERYDDAQTPITITEMGWNDSPRWVNAVSPSQRIAYLLGAYAWAAEHWDWARQMCIWVLRYPTTTQTYPDYYTLLLPDLSPKPVYYALQAYARGWEQERDLWLPPPAN